MTRKLENGWVKRYRQCACGVRWTTYEIPREQVEVAEDQQLRELEPTRD